jgi:hypothetical protein
VPSLEFSDSDKDKDKLNLILIGLYFYLKDDTFLLYEREYHPVELLVPFIQMGVFGRKLSVLETRNIYIADLEEFIGSRVIKSIIPINYEIITLLIHANIREELIIELNTDLDINLSKNYYIVKANIAIASAVTAYARIHMIGFKLDGSCIYSDTYSIFTTKPLDDKFIGSSLGLMKNELNGMVLKEAYF